MANDDTPGDDRPLKPEPRTVSPRSARKRPKRVTVQLRKRMLELRRSGITIPEIAQRLDVSESTVKAHTSDLAKRLKTELAAVDVVAGGANAEILAALCRQAIVSTCPKCEQQQIVLASTLTLRCLKCRIAYRLSYRGFANQP